MFLEINIVELISAATGHCEFPRMPYFVQSPHHIFVEEVALKEKPTENTPQVRSR